MKKLLLFLNMSLCSSTISHITLTMHKDEKDKESIKKEKRRNTLINFSKLAASEKNLIIPGKQSLKKKARASQIYVSSPVEPIKKNPKKTKRDKKNSTVKKRNLNKSTHIESMYVTPTDLVHVRIADAMHSFYSSTDNSEEEIERFCAFVDIIAQEINSEPLPIPDFEHIRSLVKASLNVYAKLILLEKSSKKGSK